MAGRELTEIEKDRKYRIKYNVAKSEIDKTPFPGKLKDPHGCTIWSIREPLNTNDPNHGDQNCGLCRAVIQTKRKFGCRKHQYLLCKECYDKLQRQTAY